MNEPYDPFDKKQILEYVISRVKEDLKGATEGYTRTTQESRDAPGAMQSQHDTSGKELAWLAQGIGARIQDLRAKLMGLEGFILPEETNHVEVGSVISLVDLNTYDDVNYAIFPGSIGESFDYHGNQITLISPGSPISRALLDRRRGESVRVRLPDGEKEFQICDIH